LASIQALRFVAVLGVMLHHSLNGAFGATLTHEYVGAAGVDLFFVISGVVIGYIDHDDGVGAFALKRLIRIVPLYWLATLAYMGWRFAAMGDHFDAARVATSFLLIPTKQGWTPIYAPGWSLCFELAFYALFGGLLSFARGRVALISALAAIFLASISIRIPGGVLDTRPFLEFGAGLLISLALRRAEMPSRGLGVAAILMALVGFATNPEPGFARVVVWGLPSALLVVGVLSLEGARAFRGRAISLLGDASYAIYLTHITVMEPIVHYAQVAGLDLQSRLRFVLLREMVLLIPATLAGVGVHLWVELPLLGMLRRAAVVPRSSPSPSVRA
jgi:exopolysaccharide production protein ExoZ